MSTRDALLGLLASVKYGVVAQASRSSGIVWYCQFCSATFESGTDAENSEKHGDDCPIRIGLDALLEGEAQPAEPQREGPALVVFSAMREAGDLISKAYSVPYDAVVHHLRSEGWAYRARYERGVVLQKGDVYWHVSPFNDGVLIIAGRVLQDAPVEACDVELEY